MPHPDDAGADARLQAATAVAAARQADDGDHARRAGPADDGGDALRAGPGAEGRGHARRAGHEAHGRRPATVPAPASAPDAAAPRAVVIGGGISGLVAARELSLLGYGVEVLEAGDAFGGCVGAHTVADLRLDAGAESFATRNTAVADLCTELGLEARLTTPSPGGSWLYSAATHGSPQERTPRARPLPATGILGIPGDPWAEDVKAAIGTAGCLRAAADLAMPVSRRLAEEPISLGELVHARMGQAVLDALVTPVVAGVHSADPATLDADSVAPGLRAALVKHGSLARAVAAMRKAAPAGSAVGGLVGGMNTLTDALVAELRSHGAALHAGTPVTGLAPNDGGAPDDGGPPKDGGATDGPAAGWRISTASGRVFSADRVVVAVPGPVAVDLLAGLLPGAAAVRPDEGAGIRLVTLVVDRPELDEAPRGNGLLVAPGTPGVRAKALTHATAKWEWLAGETGPGTHVLRLSYGRLSEDQAALAAMADTGLRDAAIADASTLLGIGLTEADVVGWDVVGYQAALPFATTGHSGRVAAFRAAVAGLDGLDVVGAWLSGTGLAAVVADTRARIGITAT